MSHLTQYLQGKPKSVNPPLRSPVMDFSASQIEHVLTAKESYSNSGPIPAQSVFSYGLPPAVQQIQDKLLTLKAGIEKFEDFASSMAKWRAKWRESTGFSKDGSPTRLAQPALPLEEGDEML